MHAAKISVLNREVAPFLAALAGLAVAALGVDALLHLTGAVWVGRYLGIPGVLLILGSFGHSLRKHRLIASGNPVKLLRRHEYMAWSGSLLVLVHAGIHFNAVLAWLATLAMVINIVSGLTGKFLLKRARKRMETTRQAFLAQGKNADEIAALMHWDSLTYGAVQQWRAVHVPITLAFGVSALGHILAVFLFWSWK